MTTQSTGVQPSEAQPTGDQPTGPQPTAWGPLLDRLEERLRLIEASALPTGPVVDLGPPVDVADRPAVAPSEDERLRLLALLAAHDRLVARLEGRRRSLRQAQQYQLGAT